MRKSLLPLLFTQILFSQGIELMQNNYPTNPSGIPYPDAEMHLFSCLTGSAAGVNGVPIILDYHQYHGWGAHIHEVGGIERPASIFFNSLIQLTGNGANPPGCVSWDVQFVGFAGGYTFTASSPGFPTKGINYITRQYNMVIGHPSFFQAYNSDAWPGAPFNQPQTLHPDQRHTPASSRFVSSDTYANFLDLSRYYKQLTNDQMGGNYDLLDITRISLPDGGVYDNDVNGISPGPDQAVPIDWNARAFEEHARGVEADIYVPGGTLRQDIAFASITTAGCYIGLYTPNGAPIGTTTETENYWRSKFIMHVSCKAGRALKGGGQRAN